MGEGEEAVERVLLHGPVAEPIYTRMAPRFPFRTGNLRFEPDDGGAGDWLVLGLANKVPISTRVPRERRILVVGEPSGMSPLAADYLAQFGTLVSPFLPEGYRGRWIQDHAGLAWFYGAAFEHGELRPRLNHAELSALPVPEKGDAVSVVISNKVLFPGHRRRLAFVEALKARLGDRLTIFGRGFREIGDKADAIAPYKLHLSLENSQEPSYWTEKLADAFLGWALPLYAGCPDIHRWFPECSLVPLDIGDPTSAAAMIEKLLEENAWQERLPAIEDARRIVLTRENFFNVVERAIGVAREHVPPPRDTKDIIVPMALPRIAKLKREAMRVYYKMTTRARS